MQLLMPPLDLWFIIYSPGHALCGFTILKLAFSIFLFAPIKLSAKNSFDPLLEDPPSNITDPILDIHANLRIGIYDFLREPKTRDSSVSR